MEETHLPSEKTTAVSISKLDRRGTISFAQIDMVISATTRAEVSEHEGLAVVGEIVNSHRIQPGEITLFGFIGNQAGNRRRLISRSSNTCPSREIS